jgi:hypothetical protein
LVVVGTLDQEDRQSLIAGRPIFQWHAKHEDLYVGQESAARVLLLPGRTESYRGFFRLLSDQHIPFAATTNLKLLETEPPLSPSLSPSDRERVSEGRVRGRSTYDLVIAPSGILPEWSNALRTRGSPQAASNTRGRSPSPPSDGGEGRGEEARSISARNAPLLDPLPTPASRGEEVTALSTLERYVRNGGRLLIAGATPPPAEFPLRKVVGRKAHTQGSWRIHDHALLPSLKDTELLFLDVELAEDFGRARAMVSGKKLPVKRAGAYGRFSLPKLGAYEVVALEPR